MVLLFSYLNAPSVPPTSQKGRNRLNDKACKPADLYFNTDNGYLVKHSNACSVQCHVVCSVWRLKRQPVIRAGLGNLSVEEGEKIGVNRAWIAHCVDHFKTTPSVPSE